MPYDLMLRGGHVIDPRNGIDAVMDVAIEDGKIAAVGPDLPVSGADAVDEILPSLPLQTGNRAGPLEPLTYRASTSPRA